MRIFLIFFLIGAFWLSAKPVVALGDSTWVVDAEVLIHHEKLHEKAQLEAVDEKPHFLERFVYGKSGRTEGAKAKKLPAAIITVLLGPLGGHRIYLGTDVKVPVIYALTLGGGFGLLPLCDLIAILVTGDIHEYADSSKIIMWVEKLSK